MQKFVNDVDMTGIQFAMENPLGAEILEFSLGGEFRAHAGVASTAQPVKLNFAAPMAP